MSFVVGWYIGTWGLAEILGNPRVVFALSTAVLIIGGHVLEAAVIYYEERSNARQERSAHPNDV